MQQKGQNRDNPCIDSRFQDQTFESMQHNLSFRGLPCSDSRFQAQTCESMQPKGQNRGNPCINSQFQAQNWQSLQQRRHKRSKPCSTSSARVPSRVDDASRHRQFASTQVRQWRQKRGLMRPEAAFPYVFAAEGAQHPPKKPPRSTGSPTNGNSRHTQRTAPQTTKAATLNARPQRPCRRGNTIIPRDRADRDGEEP